ncbi:MAG: HAMP domain-containing histidine kinase [Lachnospiraceae bacterium]
MIRKLRVRFIILSTASLLLLLGIIVISSSVLTYRELVENADRVLAMLAENGVHPLPELPPEQVRFPRTDAEKRDKEFMGPFGRRPLSPESMYEARFFAVVLSAEGQVLRVDTQRIVMVDETEAGDYGEAAYRKKGARGFIGEFRYQKLTGENSDSDHEMCVLFLDCGRNLFTFKHSLMINCLISFLGLVAVFIVIVVISGKIVRPVSESYEKQKQFISVAGHEIRTPVTIIDADAELLAMEIGDGNEWLQDICKQTKRMAVLTDNLLTLSRMDEHRQQYTMIDFPISDVVEETVLSFQALAHSRNRNIMTEIAPMLSFHGDEGSVRQLVGILLDNAIKYIREQADGGCEDILLKLGKKGRSLCLSVSNSSEPVSEEQLKRFFERFYRTEQSRDSETGGYGLGLSIARSIVEAHRGKITASAPAAGTVRITVLLPMK